MNKLEMAHEWAMKIIEGNVRAADASDLLERAWQYADAMQAEADKRKSSEFPNVLRGACGEIVAVKVGDMEWQPDWSQAPEWYDWWAMDEDCKCHWFSKKPVLEEVAGEWFLENNGEGLNNTYSPTIHCAYKGDWRDSLRKRP